MERLLSWIRDNPQFAALSFGTVVLVIVMTALTLAMSQAGASLRPLIWFLGFFGVIAGPQAVVHLLDGFVLRRERQQPLATSSNRETTVEARSTLSPVPWDTIFGPHADPTLITDAKLGLGAILGDAIEAKLSFSREGSSALAARFPSSATAASALDQYGRFFAFAGAQGSDAVGWTARRHAGQGEWVHVVTAGSELYAWTSADKEVVLANRARALGAIPASATTSNTDAIVRGPNLVSKRLSAHTSLMVGVISLNLVAAGLWFFKGSAWASRVNGATTALPVSSQQLQTELSAINDRDVPTEVTRRPDGTAEINWRYADVRWFDLMRLHRMKRTQRLVLSFDEPNRTVRVREYWSAFDASGDHRNVRLDWKVASGIQFFSFDHQRVFGVQLGADGKPTGELSKAYTFNLQALKAPIIEVITRGGWRWQPVAWNAPASLRWLTE